MLALKPSMRGCSESLPVVPKKEACPQMHQLG